MKFGRRIAAAAAAAVLALTAAIGSVSPAVQAADDTNDDWLHAVGSRLYDKDGNEVWLTGANWFGLNCTEYALHYLWSGDIDDMVKSIGDRGINVIRVPVSTELLYDWMIGNPPDMVSVNPNTDPNYRINADLVREDGTVMNSQEAFNVFLAKCKKYGIKVFIDIHCQDADNAGHNYGLWYGKSFTDTNGKTVECTTEVWTETLAWTADYYKNDDTLLGFDLKNEPHSKYGGAPIDAIWDDSTAPNNWKLAAQNCALAIMEKNPNALIFIEGVEGYEGHGAWWGGNLRGVKDHPVDIGKYQSQIVYSPHDYGPIVSAQTWFEKDFTEQTLLDDYWYDTWAYVNDKDIAPLLIGEWGGRITDSVDEAALLETPSNSLTDLEKNVKWLILLRNYMIKNHINHTFWCLNDDSGDTGGLWKNIMFHGGPDANYTEVEWDELKYSIFKPSLWQTMETGKFIGLDHQTALGENGISLGEYYASYADSEGSNLATAGRTDPIELETTAPTPTESPTAAPTEAAPTEAATQGGQLSVTRWGDADDDGDTDIIDVISVNKDQLGSLNLSAQGWLNADVDCDGQLRFTDSVYIMQSLVELVELPVTK
ncbi:MAG: glycoside hydrolase family 5 protein [Oscillospiraceae bacterium]|nr:glycoside hydrolase family 5 protein [Oscillospiraceae bacterium]